MAHIELGNQRQYFSQAAEQFGNSGDVIQNFIDGGLQTTSIVQMANESKMSNYQVDLSTKFLEKNNQINTKYQSDPTNPERERELKETFENLSGQYKISPLCQGQWKQIKDGIYNNYKQYNSQWQIKQQQTNATNDLKNGYEALTNQISMMGMNNAGVDEIRLIYKNGIDGLQKGATAVLGPEVAGQFLKDSSHDIMATYISALAVKNPLAAQKLMKDSGVLNDIGKAETIEKLNSYINNSIINQNKQIAFEELGNSLRALKSEDAKKILEGRADLNQVTKFIQDNKKIPEGSKDLILDIYGIGSKTEYYYDKDKGEITKDPKRGLGIRNRHSSSELVALSKLSQEEKLGIADNLEMQLNKMFYFDESDFETVKPKKGNQSDVVARMQNLSRMQGAIDTAYSAGIIDKTQRQNYMNKYIEPMTNYLEANMSELDERSGVLVGNKLGYDRIKKAFPVEGSKSNKFAQRKDLLTAQGYYYQALDTARKEYALNSIYDIERLNPLEQQKIYRAASENAIKYTKRNSQHPELFFKQEYPILYQEGVKMFGFKDGNSVARRVANKIYNSNEGEKINVKEAMGSAISDMHALKQNKNLQTKLKMYEEKYTVQKPVLHTSSYGNANAIAIQNYNKNLQNYNASITQRKKALKISDSDLKQTMKESGFTESQVLSLLEMQKKGITLSDL